MSVSLKSSQLEQAGEIPARNSISDSETLHIRQAIGKHYFVIEDVQELPPFFMTLVSADDHWMFIASNGAMTCGRRSAERSLFPYYCSDKLLDMRGTTGTKTLIKVDLDGEQILWQPWHADTTPPQIQRNLYKNNLGSRLCFEEVNRSIGMKFIYSWGFSPKYGFVRRSQLINFGHHARSIQILDGLTNILPSDVDPQFQLRFSNLADAYKKAELHADGRMGVYYFSSIPTDRAEPVEGLRANIAWLASRHPGQILLSERQIQPFLAGQSVVTENDIRGQRGAFLIVDRLCLAPGAQRNWTLVADVHQDHRQFASLRRNLLQASDLEHDLEQELAAHDDSLRRLAARVDGLQLSQQSRRCDRHLANSIFNAMRGGVPADGYWIDRQQLDDHLAAHNRPLRRQHQDWLEQLPVRAHCSEIVTAAKRRGDPDLIRLCQEYLPLTFSRRHGDPTRPWNVFDIDLKHTDGTTKIAYQGNWRDIFQNWEALATAYPLFLPNMIHRFVNASTADGYNPYRLKLAGFEWERPNASDPWANIGYWGDHQIVYLLKLLESCHAFLPTALDRQLTESCSVYADVPYRIRDYDQLRRNPTETVAYDHTREEQIATATADIGLDGQLLTDRHGKIHRVTLLEKLLVPAAVKMTNWIPDAGIWLNTQRPEWNDAQNALVGNGASVITTCYLFRYLTFLRNWFSRTALTSAQLSKEVLDLLLGIDHCLASLPSSSADLNTEGQTSDSPTGRTDRAAQRRRDIVDRLQQLGEHYRQRIYDRPSAETGSIDLSQLSGMLMRWSKALESTIGCNQRPDQLYHAYNLIRFDNDRIMIERLDEMLEGQLAVIESGLLTTPKIVNLLDALRNSRLYRSDQCSYLLYPNRKLPRFDQRNVIQPHWLADLLGASLEQPQLETPIVYQDCDGCYRFAADLRSVRDLRQQLDHLTNSAKTTESATEGDTVMLHQDLIDHRESLIELYEQTFEHRRFTGRANTFFAYEGLGSIYWHMVSKLALAIGRLCSQLEPEDKAMANRMQQHFREMYDGIWFLKTPNTYGAFPTDPYSHTPEHAGAQQPGMTGQVKEDVLARQLELGIRIRDGIIQFSPELVDQDEWLQDAQPFRYGDVGGHWQSVQVPAGGLAMTICQVPVVLYRGSIRRTRICFRNHIAIDRDGCKLSLEESQSIFRREHRILQIEVEWCDL